MKQELIAMWERLEQNQLTMQGNQLAMQGNQLAMLQKVDTLRQDEAKEAKAKETKLDRPQPARDVQDMAVQTVAPKAVVLDLGTAAGTRQAAQEHGAAATSTYMSEPQPGGSAAHAGTELGLLGP